MIYPFRCECGEYRETVRHSSESGLPEMCSCGREMVRVWTVPSVNMAQTGYYNHALGAYIGSKSDLKDAIRRVHDTTGSEPVEVGNERLKPKPVTSDYTLPREVMAALQD